MILWSHRGYVNKESEENTVVSLKMAYEKGCRHIEFDIWYLNGEMVLKHNEPTAEELSAGSLTKLRDYFAVYGNEMNYWMDFKNLSSENIDEALEFLRVVVNEVGIEYERIYFTPYETNWKRAVVLQRKASAKFAGIKNMLVLDEKSFDKSRVGEYSRVLMENNIRYLSIHHDFVDGEVVESLKGVNLFAWTVNEKAEFERLKKLGVENVCTDRIVYADL